MLFWKNGQHFIRHNVNGIIVRPHRPDQESEIYQPLSNPLLDFGIISRMQFKINSRKLPEHHVRLGIIIVLIGMVLINGGDIFAVKPGTLLCMLSAFSYSINIVLNSYFTRQVDPLALGVYQQGFTCLYSVIGLLVFESPIFPSTALDWISILGLALLSSAYGFVVQTVVQQYTTPENTGFLFSLEPIFAAIFSFIFLHEKLTEMGYLGAIFILAGVFTAIDAKSTVMELITGKSVAEVTSKR